MAWRERLVGGLATAVLAGVVTGCGGGSPVTPGADAQGRLTDAGRGARRDRRR